MSSSSNNLSMSYYGEETARFLKQFKIGLPNGKLFFFICLLRKFFADRIPLPIIKAYAFVKKAYAIVNEDYGLEHEIVNAIKDACDNVFRGDFDDQFPLSIWQTTSGVQINLNVNEVISNRSNQILNAIGSKRCVYPNDHVNKNQESSCVFSLGKKRFLSILFNVSF